MIRSKLNFLLAKKTPKVKWNNITSEDIAAATPNPWLPYANKQIGKPILPVLGNIKGGNSLIISFFKTNKKTIPVKAKPLIASKAYQK